MRIDRMLSIVVILLNRRKITAKELAQRFEVSVRTIYRDIESINLAGIPVISLQGTGGGYEIPENYKLSRQLLSISDMQSLLAALQGVNAALDDRQMSTLFEKIAGLLPSQPAEDAFDREPVIDFDPHGWGDNSRMAKRLPLLYAAAKNRKLTACTYCTGEGKLSDRVIEPMTLIQKGFAWYLFGYCRLRKGFRLFKLTRISRLEILPDTFERRHRHYRDQTQGWSGQYNHVQVTIRYASKIRHLVHEYHDPEEILEDTGNFCVATTLFPDGEWLMAMMLSYGSDMEVLSPPCLRQKMKARIQKMAKMYDR
jgi:predicted DNA-binding transcriptional regulator YafY